MRAPFSSRMPASVRRRLITCSVFAAVLLMVVPGLAAASDGIELTLSGGPTPAEAGVVQDSWDEFSEGFRGFGDCLQPIEVKVVDRAEDWYGGRNVGPIAAFYRYPPESIVFIEHGKVTAANLLHEYTHHLDVTCGLGEGPVADGFKVAQGLPDRRDWLSGSTWSAVPAEVFAEAVVAFFGESSSIRVTEEAVQVIEGLAAPPVQDGPSGGAMLQVPLGDPQPVESPDRAPVPGRFGEATSPSAGDLESGSLTTATGPGPGAEDGAGTALPGSGPANPTAVTPPSVDLVVAVPSRVITSNPVAPVRLLVTDTPAPAIDISVPVLAGLDAVARSLPPAAQARAVDSGEI